MLQVGSSPFSSSPSDLEWSSRTLLPPSPGQSETRLEWKPWKHEAKKKFQIFENATISCVFPCMTLHVTLHVTTLASGMRLTTAAMHKNCHQVFLTFEDEVSKLRPRQETDKRLVEHERGQERSSACSRLCSKGTSSRPGRPFIDFCCLCGEGRRRRVGPVWTCFALPAETCQSSARTPTCTVTVLCRMHSLAPLAKHKPDARGRSWPHVKLRAKRSPASHPPPNHFKLFSCGKRWRYCANYLFPWHDQGLFWTHVNVFFAENRSEIGEEVDDFNVWWFDRAGCMMQLRRSSHAYVRARRRQGHLEVDMVWLISTTICSGLPISRRV